VESSCIELDIAWLEGFGVSGELKKAAKSPRSMRRLRSNRSVVRVQVEERSNGIDRLDSTEAKGDWPRWRGIPIPPAIAKFGTLSARSRLGRQ
jgi:hypothetical protein